MVENTDPNYLLGRWLSSPPPGEEVVISGMSGRFPKSHNMQEYFDNLLNKVNMISDERTRWKLNNSEIPSKAGIINDIDKLDAGYFGVHYRQANTMCPIMRGILETAIEAIMDAGVNPRELEGSRTGVFVGMTLSEMMTEILMTTTESQKFPVTGYFYSLVAGRISYFLKLKGPAFNVDSACNSAASALDLAFRAIRLGNCNNAIVSSGCLMLHPGLNQQFFRLGVLSAEGCPRVFDNNANGYVRSETIACVFLQKLKNSRRIYATITHIKQSANGYNDSGISSPSAVEQSQLLTEIYAESNLDLSDISYLEAHGTATVVGDFQEVEALDLAIAKNRKTPLRIGSVKSNIGHSEAASVLASLAKILLAMETGKIAPNLNLKNFKTGIKGFEEGRLVPVVQIQNLGAENAIIGMNNFGFGGTNAHVILQRFNKIKRHQGLLEEDFPRIVYVSGRTKEAVLVLLTDLHIREVDKEYVALLHQIYKTDVVGHLYRGSTILGRKTQILCTTINPRTPPLYLFVGNFEKTSNHLVKDFLKIPIFKSTMKKLNEVLLAKNINLLNSLTKSSQENELVVSVAIQLALVVLFKELELKFTTVFGHSIGKLVVAFYNSTIALEEAILTAFKLGHKFSKNRLEISDKNDFAKEKNAIVLSLSDMRQHKTDLFFDDSYTFLEILGSLYQQGFNPQIHKLYSQLEFPVSRGTPMLSPLLKWNHKKSWNTYKYQQFTVSGSKYHNLTYLNDEENYMKGHIIDGKNLIPTMEYLRLVWETFAEIYLLQIANCPVVFQDCRFLRSTLMPTFGCVNLLVTIQRGTGCFEIVETESIVATGQILKLETDVYPFVLSLSEKDLEDNPKQILNQDEIYRELFLRRYAVSGAFKGLVKCNIDASSGLIRWENNWVAFMDKMIQLKILQHDSRLFVAPTAIRKIVIDPGKHLQYIENFKNDEILIPVSYSKTGNILRSSFIEITGVHLCS